MRQRGGLSLCRMFLADKRRFPVVFNKIPVKTRLESIRRLPELHGFGREEEISEKFVKKSSLRAKNVV